MARQYGLTISKDIGSINRSYGACGVSQVMKLLRKYRRQCDEKGEVIIVPDNDAESDDDDDTKMDTRI